MTAAQKIQMTQKTQKTIVSSGDDAVDLLLLASPLPLSEQAVPRPDDGGAALARTALETGLAGCLYVRLSMQGALDGLSQEVREGLEAAFVLNSERNANLLRQMQHLDTLLREVDIAPVFLKGAAILLAKIYPAQGARFMRDLDVLVPPDRIEAAVDAAQAGGYRIVIPEHDRDRYRLGIGRSGFHVHPMVHPDFPGDLELHRAFDGRTTCHALTAKGIIEDAVTSDTGGLLRPKDSAMMGMALTHHLRKAPVWGPRPLGIKDSLDLLYLSDADPDLTKRTAKQSRRLAIALDVADRVFVSHGAGRLLGSDPRLDGKMASAIGRALNTIGLWEPVYQALNPWLWRDRLQLAWHSRAYRTYLASRRCNSKKLPSEQDLWKG